MRSVRHDIDRLSASPLACCILLLPHVAAVGVAKALLAIHHLIAPVASTSRRQRLILPACSGNAALALLLFSEGGLVVDINHLARKSPAQRPGEVDEATLETTAIKRGP